MTPNPSVPATPAAPRLVGDISIGEMQRILAKTMGCPLDETFPDCSHGADAWEYSRHLIRDGYAIAPLRAEAAAGGLDALAEALYADSYEVGGETEPPPWTPGSTQERYYRAAARSKAERILARLAAQEQPK